MTVVNAVAAERMAALVSSALRTEDEPELFQLLADWVAQNRATGRISVAMIADGDPGHIAIVARSGLLPQHEIAPKLPLDTSAIGRCIRTGQVHRWVASPDSEEFEGPDLARDGLGECLNVPLWSDGHVVGSLNYVKRIGESISSDDVDILVQVGVILSAHLDRFRRLSHTRQELDRARKSLVLMEEVNHIGLDLSAARGRAEALCIAARALLVITPDVERVTVGIPSSGGFEVSVLIGEADETGPRIGSRLPLRGSGMGEVLASGQLLVWQSLSESRYPEHRKLAGLGFHSGLSVPIPVAGRVGAVLNAASRQDVRLGPELRHALQSLANLIGSVLERVDAQEETDRQARRLDMLIDDSPLLLLTVKTDGTIDRSSRFAAHRLGRDPQDLRGSALAELYVPEHRADCLRRIRALIAAAHGEVDSWEAQILDVEGPPRWVRHTARRLESDATGVALLIVAEDITDVRRLAVELEHEASHDALTGLINRRELDRRLFELDHSDGPFSLCFIDIDHFKLINDTCGHRAGDEVLVQLTACLSAITGRDDLLARHGGDELVLMLPQCTLPDAVRVAERLRLAARDLVIGDQGRTHRITLSIGVASLERSLTPAAMLSDADAACYAAKAAGRDRVSTSKGGSTNELLSDGRWVDRVRQALEHGGLHLYSQAIAATATPQLPPNRCEILIRLQDGDQVISAGQFIPACERYGLIDALDRWVVTEVVNAMLARPEPFRNVQHVSINLSAHSVQSADFLEFLVDVLSAPGLDPARLLFEITETAAVTNFANANRFMQATTPLGCSFAIDDFGSGFATFGYLRRLPLDVIKIDGSLVTGLKGDFTNQQIIRSVTQVADALGMRTVAEFVEDASDVPLLARLGVDFAQGFGIARPRPLDDFLDQHEARLRPASA